MKRSRSICLLSVILQLCLFLIATVSVAGPLNSYGVESDNPYVVSRFTQDGKAIDEVIVPGRPPENYRAPEAIIPKPSAAAGTNTLSNVPAFDWSYGCSATSAAMMFGYYDNIGYPNMYAGPTNGGVCPMTNAAWGAGECPLSATHQGFDGRTIKGHVDDYWIEYGSTSPDPYIGHWTEHVQGECTGDFMGTNQSSKENTDGSTTFYNYTDGSPLYDYTGAEPGRRDGCHGMKLFSESRGYAVTSNYNQYILGYNGNIKGFTFSQYKQEIDAGRPVLIQVVGHTMLGYGYDDASSTVYLRDTWDHTSHSMTWGGSYSGMQHTGVTVFVIAPAPTPTPSPSPTPTPTPVPVLSVTPSTQNVGSSSGSTSFGVSNTGAGTMAWTASVISGSTWLSISSGGSGSNSGTIGCSFSTNTSSTSRTATIRVTAAGATGSPVDVTVTQAGSPTLSVTPTYQNVSNAAGSTSFSVSNIGTGTMPWTASVISGSTWLSISSGGSGSNSGIIECSFSANTSSTSRTATIRITATGATGSPVDVTVTQTSGSVPVLSVTPTNQNVTKDAGSTAFTVSNTGTGTMTWTASVTSGNSWLTITSGSSGINSGPIICSFPANASSSSRTATITITANGTTGSPATVTVTQEPLIAPVKPNIGSNSIDDMDVVKITDMSGSLPAGGGAVTVRAWDKNGNEITQASYAPILTVTNYSTTSIRGMDIADRFPDGEPSTYVFSVESPKMFITNVNNSNDGAVKVPIIFSSGISTFISNSIGPRNTVKITDMSGALPSSGTAVSIRAWDVSGNEIPESTSAAAITLYNHGTTSLAGSSIAARFPSGSPMTYAFSIASSKLVISNVKNSSDGTLNIPSVYTAGVSNFASNSIGPRNTIYISDYSGNLASGGSSVTVRAWDASGTEIPESEWIDAYKIYNFETIKIQGSDLASRFPTGTPITYEFTVASSKFVITNIKSSSNNVINIPTVYSSGMTNYATNYVSDLNTIKISDMSGSIPTGGAAITVVARDVDGNQIAESSTAAALKLYNFGTTTIAGSDLQDRFPGGTPVSYEFTIGSSNAIVTNLTNSTDGTINIPTVYNVGSYGGI